MLDLLFLLLLGCWSAAVGRATLRRLGLAPEDVVDRIALAIPLGLGTLALATLGLAEIGCLDRAGLGVVLALGCLWAVMRIAPLAPPGRGEWDSPSTQPLC